MKDALKDLREKASAVTEELKEIKKEVKQEGQKLNLFVQLEERLRSDYVRLVPSGVDGEQILRGVLNVLRGVPERVLFSKQSVSAITQAFVGGLNPLFGEIVFATRRSGGEEFLSALISYRGMILLAVRSGLVKSVYAQTVHEGDEFMLSFAPPRVRHVIGDPHVARDESTFVGVWGMATLSSGDRIVEYASKSDIDYLRSLSRDKGFSSWSVSYTAMARAKVLRKMLNRFPVLNLSYFEEETADEE